MRTVHISDLHLSSDNEFNFKTYYLEALLTDLKVFNAKKKIELIFLTGDLVDRAGKSLGVEPYKILNDIFISELTKNLNIPPERIVMIPGNHDVDTDTIILNDELRMLKLINANDIDSYVNKNKNILDSGISRLKRYKEFEAGFYSNLTDKYLTNFESCFIYEIEGLKIGIGAFNSAWRCSPNLPKNSLPLGNAQILAAQQFFRGKTNFNIALIHHPLELFCDAERMNIFRNFANFKFPVVLCGHIHSSSATQQESLSGNLYISSTRSAFNNPDEEFEKFQPGYNIIDFKFSKSGDVELDTYFRKYQINRVSFDKDVESKPDGFLNRKLPTKVVLPADYSSSDPNYETINAITDVWNKVTDVLLNSAFPELGTKLGDIVKNYLLPKKLEQYHKDLNISYEISKYDDDHFALVENESFTIISNEQPIIFEWYNYIEKEKKETDKSDIEATSFSIDGVDYNKQPYVITQFVDLDPETIRKRINFKVNLKDKKAYKIIKITKSIHSLKLNGIWRYDINEITENLSLNIRNIDTFELDLLKFGHSRQLYKEDPAFLDTRRATYENLLMPGEGFVLVIKKKN